MAMGTSRLPWAVVRRLLCCLVVGCLFLPVGAQVTVGSLSATLVEDACSASSLGGPNFPDPGDTLRLWITLTNNTGSNASFRVVFRAWGTTGGTGASQTVDLWFGGAVRMRTGLAVSGWDDSFGQVFNTPLIQNGASYTAQTNFSLNRQQLTNALNLPKNGSGAITFAAEVFNSNFATFYGSSISSQTVTNTRKKDCASPQRDAVAVVLLTNKTLYSSSDTISIEWAVLAAEENEKLPSYGDDASAAILDVVRLDSGPDVTGNPPLDFQNGTVVLTLSTFTLNAIASCTLPCSATDESVSQTFRYSYNSGDMKQAYTQYASISASTLTNDRHYLLRVRPRPEDPSAGSSSHPIQEPQWNYFGVGNPQATPVTLESFLARRSGSHWTIDWTTAAEAGNLGFWLEAETAEGWRRVGSRPLLAVTGDGTASRRYRVEIPFRPALSFRLEDVNLFGQTRVHGPFRPEIDYGWSEPPREIDWEAVRREQRHDSRELTAGRSRSSRAGRRAARQGWPTVDLRVDRTGLYRVTHEQLRQAGADFAGVHPRSLALLKQGQPVPMRVGSADGYAGGAKDRWFGEGFFIEFYGEAAGSLYTDEMVYQLLVDASRVERFKLEASPARPNARPQTIYQETSRFGRNREYSFAAPNGDPWYDTGMLVWTEGREWTFDFIAGDLQPGAGQPVLTIEVWGVTDWPLDPDHHLVVEVNGTVVAERFFDGLSVETLQILLPDGLVREGTNQLKLRLPGDTGAEFDLIHLEDFRLTYPRALRARQDQLAFVAGGEAIEVGGLASPDALVYRLGRKPAWVADPEFMTEGEGWRVRFPGHKEPVLYLVATPDQLLAPRIELARGPMDLLEGQADYLMISHPHFLDELAPLVAAREAEGLNVRVVDVEEVYAAYSHGVFDPEAIRLFIADAAHGLGVRAVLLVGADSYDYHDYLGLGSISFIPSLYAATGNIVRFAPSDALLADLDGDGIPDLPIGRFPVRTRRELANLIAKTLDYPGAERPQGQAVLAADAGSSGSVRFRQQSELFLEALGPGWKATRVYLDDSQVGAARILLGEAIGGGAALTNFIGHSGPRAWTFVGLFTTQDALTLSNFGQPTVVLQWGCWNTYHVDPQFDTLGHGFLLADGRGAAAVLGSTTLSEAASAEALSRLLAPLIAQPGLSLGEAVTQAKQRLGVARPDLVDVLLGWTLLGDPMLRIQP